MIDEQWRDAPGFEGIYSVSDLGRVLSHERTCEAAAGARRVRQRLLKQTTQRLKNGRVGTCIVKLSRPAGKSEYFSVGRLVLLAFVGDSPGRVAHFKDGNPANARLDNLEWSDFSTIAAESAFVIPPTRWNRAELPSTGRRTAPPEALEPHRKGTA